MASLSASVHQLAQSAASRGRLPLPQRRQPLLRPLLRLHHLFPQQQHPSPPKLRHRPPQALETAEVPVDLEKSVLLGVLITHSCPKLSTATSSSQCLVFILSIDTWN